MKSLVIAIVALAIVGGVAWSLVYVATRPSATEIAARKWEKGLPALGAALERTGTDLTAVRRAQVAVDETTRELFDYHVRYYVRNGIDRKTAGVFAESDLEHEDGVAPALAQRIANGG